MFAEAVAVHRVKSTILPFVCFSNLLHEPFRCNYKQKAGGLPDAA